MVELTESGKRLNGLVDIFDAQLTSFGEDGLEEYVGWLENFSLDDKGQYFHTQMIEKLFADPGCILDVETKNDIGKHQEILYTATLPAVVRYIAGVALPGEVNRAEVLQQGHNWAAKWFVREYGNSKSAHTAPIYPEGILIDYIKHRLQLKFGEVALEDAAMQREILGYNFASSDINSTEVMAETCIQDVEDTPQICRLQQDENSPVNFEQNDEPSINSVAPWLSPAQEVLFTESLGLAYTIANEFVTPNTNMHDREDLRQAALIGLAAAASRFDQELGNAFSSFAAPTIRGTLKRHLRDNTWSVRVPRVPKELYLRVRNYLDDGSDKVDIQDISDRTGLGIEEVNIGLSVQRARNVNSLNDDASGESKSLLDRLPAAEEDEIDAVEMMDFQRAMGTLDDLLVTIVRLRMEGLSQTEIGEKVGYSQMHVGRLLKKACKQLGDYLQLSA